MTPLMTSRMSPLRRLAVAIVDDAAAGETLMSSAALARAEVARTTLIVVYPLLS